MFKKCYNDGHISILRPCVGAADGRCFLYKFFVSGGFHTFLQVLIRWVLYGMVYPSMGSG